MGIPIEALHNSSKKAFCLPLLDGYLKLVKWSSGQRQGEQILTRRPKGGASQSWWTFWGDILDVYSFFFFFFVGEFSRLYDLIALKVPYMQISNACGRGSCIEM